ncbi:MAG: hypothetical protein ABSG51_02155 [Terracidiphilus sp.]|jgi:hypothetical protein
MKPDRFVIAAVVFLAIGLYLIFGYCNGSVTMSAGGASLSAITLNIAVSTSGPGAIGGPVLTGFGVLLLLWALVCALISQARLIASWRRAKDKLKSPPPPDVYPKN